MRSWNTAPPRSRSARLMASTRSSTAARTCLPSWLVTSASALADCVSRASRVSLSATVKKRRTPRRVVNASSVARSSAQRVASHVAVPVVPSAGASTRVQVSPLVTRPSRTVVARHSSAMRSIGLAAQRSPPGRWFRLVPAGQMLIRSLALSVPSSPWSTTTRSGRRVSPCSATR